MSWLFVIFLWLVIGCVLIGGSCFLAGANYVDTSTNRVPFFVACAGGCVVVLITSILLLEWNIGAVGEPWWGLKKGATYQIINVARPDARSVITLKNAATDEFHCVITNDALPAKTGFVRLSDDGSKLSIVQPIEASQVPQLVNTAEKEDRLMGSTGDKLSREFPKKSD